MLFIRSAKNQHDDSCACRTTSIGFQLSAGTVKKRKKEKWVSTHARTLVRIGKKSLSRRRR